MRIIHHVRLGAIAAVSFGGGLLVAQHAAPVTVATYGLPIVAGLMMFLVGLAVGWRAGETSLVVYKNRTVYAGDVLPSPRPALGRATAAAAPTIERGPLRRRR